MKVQDHWRPPYKEFMAGLRRIYGDEMKVTHIIRKFAADTGYSAAGVEKWWYGANNVPAPVLHHVDLMGLLADIRRVGNGQD